MRLAKMLVVVAAFAVPAASSSSVHAQGDPFAHNAIERGEFAEAETALRAKLAVDPTMPEVLLNLAAIYARTNRLEQAQVLYQRVLTTEDVSLLLRPDYAMNAHAIAERGLRKLDSQRMAGR